MKFALAHFERTMPKESISISFFFGARGRDLEKSIIGMYRSLLFQLLKKLPRLQGILDSINLSRMSARWELEILKQTFRCAIEQLEQEHLLCFVDALDKCPEDQVRDLITFFESLNHLRRCPGPIATRFHFYTTNFHHGSYMDWGSVTARRCRSS